MAWTTPKTWVANDVLTAADMNTHVRDNFNAASTWTSYTPTWAATGGTPSLGNGALNGGYILVGDLLLLRISLLWGSTTSAAGTTLWTFSLPSGVAVDGFSENQLQATAYDGSTGTVAVGWAYPATTSKLQPIFTGANQRAGASIPWTWASTDRLQIQGFANV